MGERSSRRFGAAATKAIVVLMMALLLGLVQGPVAAQAKSLKASGVKFTTKNKTISTKYWYAGIGKQKVAYKISNLKVKDAAQEGYRTATFTISWTRKWAPSKTQVTKMVSKLLPDGSLNGGHYWAFVTDLDTGENLANEAIGEKYDVSVKFGAWKYSKHKTYRNGDAWVKIATQAKRRVTVTYPANYTRLCVGFGFGQTKYSERQMTRWGDGKVTYGQSWWHRKNKASTRFILIK